MLSLTSRSTTRSGSVLCGFASNERVSPLLLDPDVTCAKISALCLDCIASSPRSRFCLPAECAVSVIPC